MKQSVRKGVEREKHFSPSPFSLAYSYLCKQNNLLTMRLLRLIPLIMTLCLAVACSDDDGDGNKHDMRHRRTVIVYMSAQNSLGAANAAQADSSEIAGGAMQMTSTRDNLLLYLDDNRNPRLYRYYKAGNGKAYVQKVKEYQTDLDSSDPSTLTEVLTTVKNLYPSESYGLVMWSHGTGWLPQMGRPTLTAGTGSLRTTQSIGIDVGPGGNMESDLDAEGHMGPQMETADMARAIVASGVHPDFVFFDACLMQCIEVAYDLREATDYVVGSPATTSAYGAYYRDQILQLPEQRPNHTEHRGHVLLRRDGERHDQGSVHPASGLRHVGHQDQRTGATGLCHGTVYRAGLGTRHGR